MKTNFMLYMGDLARNNLFSHTFMLQLHCVLCTEQTMVDCYLRYPGRLAAFHSKSAKITMYIKFHKIIVYKKLKVALK